MCTSEFLCRALSRRDGGFLFILQRFVGWESCRESALRLRLDALEGRRLSADGIPAGYLIGCQQDLDGLNSRQWMRSL